MPAHQPIYFVYMPKTNQIVEKAYQTSLDSKIEKLKPGSACLAHTRNDFFSKKFGLDKRQKVNIKVKNSLAFKYRKT